MDGNKVESGVLLVGYEDEENLGLRSIAAYLEDQDVGVKIVPFRPWDGVLSAAVDFSPKIVGFSLIFQKMLNDFAELIEYLRENSVRSHFTTGGHFPTIEYDATLRAIPGLDSVVRHEGEETLLELYRHLDEPHLWPRIRGLVYRRDGHLTVTPPRPLIRDLDTLPFPKRGRLRTYRGLGMCSMLASRGCPYRCSFCSIHTFYGGTPGPNRRVRSPSNLAEEMEGLFRRGVQIFNFKDDDFAMTGSFQRRWIYEFADELDRRSLSGEIFWRISTRVDELDRNVIRRLKEVGLGFLYLGIESGSDDGLETCKKGYGVKDIRRALADLERTGMDFEYGFMLLDPYSTFSSLKANVEMLREICKDGRVVVHFTKMFPYAGTPIAEQVKGEGRSIGPIDSPDYSYLDPRFSLLEVFISRAFHDMLFEPKGLVTRLQFAKFDSVILQRFYPDVYMTQSYAEEVRNLTNRCNESVLETIELATGFMEKRSYEEILSRWDLVELLLEQELKVQSNIGSALDRLTPEMKMGRG